MLSLDRVGVDAEGEREAGLGVEVDQQHPLALLGERGAQRGHRRVLATPPFWLATAMIVALRFGAIG